MKPIKQAEDWIAHIAKTVYENYQRRKVVLWGKYDVSDEIRVKLQTEYKIETAFYIESDSAKTDGSQVFSPDCLCGKSEEYYVIVPLSFHQTIKDKLMEAGYQPNIDYCYFSDCILRKEFDYYEDAHGNRIIGNYQGLKFAFSGFDSVIEIGEGVSCKDSNIYLHNNCRVIIGKASKLQECTLFLNHFSSIVLDTEASLTKSCIHIETNASAYIGNNTVQKETDIWGKDDSDIEINAECYMEYFSLVAGNGANVSVKEAVRIYGYDIYRKTRWVLKEDSKLRIGRESTFLPGRMDLCERTELNIGREFTIGRDYLIIVDQDTHILIGDDCMFSYDIRMLSNDCHSIFDILTGENLNAACKGEKRRQIVFGDHVWVGMSAHILYDSEVADGSIIGAMSLVKGKIPNNCMAAGVPARVIRKNIAWCRENGATDIAQCGKAYSHLTREG